MIVKQKTEAHVDKLNPYPSFQPEQVLTGLEELGDYLDKQSKTLRSIYGYLAFITVILILSLVFQFIGCRKANESDHFG